MIQARLIHGPTIVFMGRPVLVFDMSETWPTIVNAQPWAGVKNMNDKALYQQKMQAQLDDWKADLSKLKARASAASADAQLEVSAQLQEIEAKIEDGKVQLAAISESGDGAWESLKDGAESAWESIKMKFGDARAKFKD